MTAATKSLADVLDALQAIAPLELAADWDNVGLLLEPRRRRAAVARVLLTIDLTDAVVAEALTARADLVVAYHPAIFQPLKRLVADDGKQRALLAAATAGIAVYSPHTALDAAPGGIADWLAAAVLDDGDGEVAPCDAAGFGRVARLPQALGLPAFVTRIKRRLGVRHVQVARPSGSMPRLRTVAVAAGAGGSVVRGADADAVLTGEMSHHDALAAVASGRTVVLAGHSNTERGYLRVLRGLLRRALGKGVDVRIAASDRDPFAIA